MTVIGLARLTALLLHIGPLMAASGLLAVAQLLSPRPRSWPYQARGWVIRQILLGVVWYDPSVRSRASGLLERMDEVNRNPPDPRVPGRKPTPPDSEPPASRTDGRQ